MKNIKEIDKLSAEDLMRIAEDDSDRKSTRLNSSH